MYYTNKDIIIILPAHQSDYVQEFYFSSGCLSILSFYQDDDPKKKSCDRPKGCDPYLKFLCVDIEHDYFCTLI